MIWHSPNNGFIFQHDNDLRHTANTAKAKLDRKTDNGTLSVIDWPPQSMDLNITPTMWDHPDREQNKRQHPKRIQAMLTNKGGPTKNGLSGLLGLSKLSFPLYTVVSIYVCTYFSKSSNYFPFPCTLEKN